MPGPEVFRGWAAAEGFRGVGDAAPYAGGCPLTGSRANLRRGAGTPPYGWNSRRRGRCGHSLIGRSVGRGLDPSVGVYGRHGLAHRRAVGAGHARPGGFPGDGRQQKVSGASGTPPPTRVGCPLTGSRANLRRGVGTPPYGWNSRKRGRGGLYAPPASLCGMPFAGCCFSFNIGLAIRLKMYPRCRAWTFDN